MTSERKFIAENIRRVLLKEYLMKTTERAGFGDLDIQRTPLGTRVTLIAERPGMVIGRKGATIKELTKVVEEDFKFDNPQIEVQEAPNPNLNPQIMAQKLVSALERGWHFRRAGHSTVRQIMSAGAKGCQVIISGKLTGQRHRVEKFKEGHIKFCGEPKKQWMREGFAVAKKKLGIIGVKVQIMDPHAKLPDEVEIIPDNELQLLLKAQAEAAEEVAKTEAEESLPASAITKVKKKTRKKTEDKEKPAEETETDSDSEDKDKKSEKKDTGKKPRETKSKDQVKKDAEEPAEKAAAGEVEKAEPAEPEAKVEPAPETPEKGPETEPIESVPEPPAEKPEPPAPEVKDEPEPESEPEQESSTEPATLEAEKPSSPEQDAPAPVPDAETPVVEAPPEPVTEEKAAETTEEKKTGDEEQSE